MAIGGLLVVSPALAHPHVWITMTTKILFNGDKAITGVRHAWTFDEFYTAFAIQGLDKNKDGIYSREELQELATVNVITLKKFHHFTFVKSTGKPVKVLMPVDYYLDHTGGLLTLYFTMPFAKPIPAERIKDFTLTVYDPSFYVDIGFAKKNPVSLIAAPPACVPLVKAPRTDTTSVQSLGEAFFNDTNAAADLAAKYAKTVSISCPNS
ncbi:MAG: DUF1007 family protein [Alphaproteobacteria bacterium]